MKLLSTEITNFGPYRGKHTFQIADRGLVMVLGDNRDEPRMINNGSGKTSLFDAIDWCFYGVVPKRDHADSILHDDSGKEGAEVTNRIEDDDGTIITIRRFRKMKGQSGVHIHVGEEEYTTLDTRESNRMIENLLGMDREIFHASMYYGQEDQFEFADATDSERMKILTKVLQLSQIDEWLDKAKLQLSNYEADSHKTSEAIAVMRGEYAGLSSQTFDDKASQWEEERAQSLRQATKQLNDFLTNIEAQKETLKYEQRCWQNLEALQVTVSAPIDWSNFDHEISKARDAEYKVKSELMRVEADGKYLRKAKDKVVSAEGTTCSECGQEVSKEHAEKEKAAYDHDLEKLRVQYTELDTKLKAATSKVLEWEQSKKDQQMVHEEANKVNSQQLMEAKDQWRTIEEAKRYVEHAEAHVKSLRENMRITQEKVNPWLEKKAEVGQRLQQLESRIHECEVNLKNAEQDSKYLEFWIDGFGAKGLKSYILDTKLQAITDAANKWVKLLTGGTFWIRLETQKKGRSTKKLSNEINLRVFRYNPDGTVTERGYRSCSGGEKKRVSWAVDFGLSMLVSSRASKNWSELILDEVFKHVDRAGGEAIVEMLHRLATEKTSIFVIEQDSDFQSHFENKVVIRKENKCSQIIEESGDEQGIQSKRQKAPRRSPVRKKKQGTKAKRSRVSSRTPRRKKRQSRQARRD